VNPQQIVEAVLFASDAPLTADEIARADETLDEDKVEAVLQALRAEYDDAHRAFEIVELAEGYQILTRPEFASYLERFDNVPRPSRLSGPALETLAIIAYRQPLARLEVEYIRGVGASGVIRTLQDRRLIDVVGRAEGLGRPLLYGTTQHFLEHFGFRSLEDLPRPEELPIVLRERIPLGLDDGGEGEGESEADEAGQAGLFPEGGRDESAEGVPGPDSEPAEAHAPEDAGDAADTDAPEEDSPDTDARPRADDQP
jgi:segregation and condensation protein B